MMQSQMQKSPCEPGNGRLPDCLPLAFPYVPVQKLNPERMENMEALQTGTLFPGLDLPFKSAIKANTNLPNTAMVELMAIDFAIDELGLYLVTHADDQEALDLYWSYIKLAAEGRNRYEERYGPLYQTAITADQGYAWLKDPWPWEYGGED